MAVAAFQCSLTEIRINLKSSVNSPVSKKRHQIAVVRWIFAGCFLLNHLEMVFDGKFGD